MILLRDLVKDNLQKIFGEEKGGVRGTPTPLWILIEGAMSKGGVHKLQMFGREKYSVVQLCLA